MYLHQRHVEKRVNCDVKGQIVTKHYTELSEEWIQA